LETSDYNSFAKACLEHLKILQDKFQNEYDLDWYDNWFYNQSTGLLTFSTGSQELNFKYFNVGSFSEKSKTWKWSWRAYGSFSGYLFGAMQGSFYHPDSVISLYGL
jgi:hypothetical protein